MSTSIESTDKSEVIQTVENVSESNDSPRKRGRKSKYATEEERIEARRRQQREYRRRKKEELERLREFAKLNGNQLPEIDSKPHVEKESKSSKPQTRKSKVQSNESSKSIPSKEVEEFYDDGTL